MQIVVSKLESRVDELIEIKIIEVPNNEKVVIKAEMMDERGSLWVSEGIYNAKENNEINLNTDESQGGSYEGVEAMGLFWSMASNRKSDFFYSCSLKPLDYQITAIAGDSKAEISISRTFLADDVIVKNLSNRLLQGTYFYHESVKPKGNIVLFGGSEGGNDMMRAAVLASHGYNVVAAYYFGAGALPKELINVPLEFFNYILKFINERVPFNDIPLTVIGSSRGAELTLLLSTLYKEINQIISISGSAYAVQGISREILASAWIYKEKELPYISCKFNVLDMLLIKIKSYKKEANSAEYFKIVLKRDKNIEEKRIKSELFKGRVVLIYGEEDKLWPTKDMAEVIIKDRNITKLENQTIKLNYEKAGHVFQIPYLPIIEPVILLNGSVEKLGGTTKENFRASEDSHFHILRLLDNTKA